MAPGDAHDAATVAEQPTSSDSYKYQWARYVARQKLKRDTEAAEKRMEDLFQGEKFTVGTMPQTVTELAQIADIATGGGLIPEKHGEFKVGIVGAGVAGLFTALALDWINDTIEKNVGPGQLNITYDILEAASEDRFGGRLYTHQFSDGVHDYYDVGAMRFPQNNIMDRTFRLFNMLNIKKGQLGDRTKVSDPPVLIPYYLKDDNNVCPAYFNDVKKVGNAWDGTIDPFDLNKGVPEPDRIPDDRTKEDPSDLFKNAIEGFIFHVKKTMDSLSGKKDPEPRDEKEIWELLQFSDRMSVRQFLLSGKNPGEIPDGPNYSYNTVQWLETATYGTGWYDQSLAEAVLEALDFTVPKDLPTNDYWFCIDGGAQKIAETMRAKMKDPSLIRYNTKVVGMDATIQLNKRVSKAMQLSLKDSTSGKPLESRSYFTVVSSTTMGAMNRMDLSRAGLLWDTKQAIRCLGYGASCKVGIKFRTAWWRKEPYNITKGGLARTDLPLQVCVYPSYNINDEIDPVDKPAVLLVSYTWGQTAQRLATLIASKAPGKSPEDIMKEETELRDVLLRDLAFLHAEDPKDQESFHKTLDEITEQYSEHHAYDWYHDPHMAGAFAYFGPCQFSELYPAITKPNAFGQLYFVGEAASAHHAWVVGALESVIRGLWLMFNNLHQGSKNDPKLSNNGKGYRPYLWAMQLLQSGAVKDADVVIDPSPEPLPFYPLPAEMPEGREKDVAHPDGPAPAHPSQELLDHPQLDGPGKEAEISYGAAMVALSMVESVLDEWGKPNVKVEIPVAMRSG